MESDYLFYNFVPFISLDGGHSQKVPPLRRSILSGQRAAFLANVAMLKVQAIMHDGSVGLEFMIDDPTEAEEMRTQCLAFNCVAEVRVLDEPGWVKV